MVKVNILFTLFCACACIQDVAYMLVLWICVCERAFVRGDRFVFDFVCV